LLAAAASLRLEPTCLSEKRPYGLFSGSTILVFFLVLFGICQLFPVQSSLAAPDNAVRATPIESGNEIAVPTGGATVLETPGDSPPGDTDLQLALKSINLSQGEGGFELWRLKAEWATMRKRDETVLVEKPQLTYFIKDGGSPLLVQSAEGSIDQKAGVLRFLDTVRVSRDTKLLTSDMLVYQGDNKTMTFPFGGEFSDTGVAGSAGHLVWRIDEKRIDASGGVSVQFTGSREKQDDQGNAD
jgi:hypothetical protein